MEIFKDCIREIRLFCESIKHIPAGNDYYRLIDGWIDCLNEWSCDKTPQQIENIYFLILNDYTDNRFRHNWNLEQYIITTEVLELYGYDDYVDEYYHSYDDSDDDFLQFWHNLDIDGNTLREINKDAMRYFAAYQSLFMELKRFAEIRNINFADYAKRAQWHEDFYSIQNYTTGVQSSNSNWQDYIIGANKDAWINLIREELNNAGNKNGRLMAVIILALQKNSAIKTLTSKKRFYDALRMEFPNLNSDTAINNYLNAESPNSYTPPIPEDEINTIINKIGCY